VTPGGGTTPAALVWVVVVVVVVVVADPDFDVVPDFVTVVLEVPGAGWATLVGSEFKSIGSNFPCACGAGFGCEQETRQSTRKRDAIVFIF
jgi:hypothetical protein